MKFVNEIVEETPRRQGISRCEEQLAEDHGTHDVAHGDTNRLWIAGQFVVWRDGHRESLTGRPWTHTGRSFVRYGWVDYDSTLIPVSSPLEVPKDSTRCLEFPKSCF